METIKIENIKTSIDLLYVKKSELLQEQLIATLDCNTNRLVEIQEQSKVIWNSIQDLYNILLSNQRKWKTD